MLSDFGEYKTMISTRSDIKLYGFVCRLTGCFPVNCAYWITAGAIGKRCLFFSFHFNFDQIIATQIKNLSRDSWTICWVIGSLGDSVGHFETQFQRLDGSSESHVCIMPTENRLIVRLTCVDFLSSKNWVRLTSVM